MAQSSTVGVQKDRLVKADAVAALWRKNLSNLPVRPQAKVARTCSARKQNPHPRPGDDAVREAQADLDSYQDAALPVYSTFALGPVLAEFSPSLAIASAILQQSAQSDADVWPSSWHRLPPVG